MSEYYLDDTLKILRKSGLSYQWKSFIENHIRDGNIDMAYNMIKAIYDDVSYIEYSLKMNDDCPIWREHDQ